MRTEPTWTMGGSGTSGIVEADETYWGSTRAQRDDERGYEHKMTLVTRMHT